MEGGRTQPRSLREKEVSSLPAPPLSLPLPSAHILATLWSHLSPAPTYLSIKTSAVSDSLPSWSLTSSLGRREVDGESGQPQLPNRCLEKIREEIRRGRLIEGGWGGKRRNSQEWEDL